MNCPKCDADISDTHEFEQAQSAMWNAERLWRDAEMQVQYAFVALAADGELTAAPKED